MSCGFPLFLGMGIQALNCIFMLENNGSPSIMFEIINSQMPQTSTLLLHKFEVWSLNMINPQLDFNPKILSGIQYWGELDYGPERVGPEWLPLLEGMESILVHIRDFQFEVWVTLSVFKLVKLGLKFEVLCNKICMDGYFLLCSDLLWYHDSFNTNYIIIFKCWNFPKKFLCEWK